MQCKQSVYWVYLDKKNALVINANADKYPGAYEH